MTHDSMSVIAAALGGDSRVSRIEPAGSPNHEVPRAEGFTEPRGSGVAWLGTCLLLMAAPFESLQPLLRLPGQSLSSVEAVLSAVFLAWLVALARSRVVPAWRTPLTWPWVTFCLAALVAALASSDRMNALHMTGRFGLAFGVYLVTVNGLTSLVRLRGVITAAAIAGAIVSVLVLLEFVNAGPVMEWLRHFRTNLAHVGADVRAGGPFQYPTIASMYLEICFALTLGFLLLAVDQGRRGLTAIIAVLLVVIAEAITVTFTRAGFISMAASLGLVGALRFRQRGADRGVAAVAALSFVIGLQLVASQSVESLRLRMTTDGQNAWYNATIDAPSHVAIGTGDTIIVPVTLTNTGYSSWDPNGANRFRLSYHWLLPNQDRIVSWDGIRTDFPEVVKAGERITLQARVIAPREAGEYRLMWDIEQEGRLWFSTEPDADLFFSRAAISGPSAGGVDVSQLPPLPRRAVRPGRVVLWGAAGRMLAEHPILGVGPDNFRLRYGGYAGLADADPRVHSNNMYLEVLTGGGILAGLAFLWLLWAASSRALALARRSADSRAAPLAAATVAAAATIALHGLVDSFLGFTGTYILMAITLGLIVSGERFGNGS